MKIQRQASRLKISRKLVKNGIFVLGPLNWKKKCDLKIRKRKFSETQGVHTVKLFTTPHKQKKERKIKTKKVEGVLHYTTQEKMTR